MSWICFFISIYLLVECDMCEPNLVKLQVGVTFTFVVGEPAVIYFVLKDPAQ